MISSRRTPFLAPHKIQMFERTRAGILLLADQSSEGPAWKDEDIAQAVGVAQRTVEKVRQRFVEQGFEAALERKKRKTPPVAPKLTGDKEARIIALACSPSPKGRARWTLVLLAEKLLVWKTCLMFTSVPMTRTARWSVWTNRTSSFPLKSARPFPPNQVKSDVKPQHP